MTKTGLFVGLITLDLVYLTATYPDKNQKVVASNYAVTAGGPATNAAVTFSYFNNQTILLGGLGNHPITYLIKADLEKHNVRIQDLDNIRSEPPPVSSIITTQDTGDRAVISINATKSQISKELIDSQIIHDVDIVLIDGHQMVASLEIAQFAKSKNIPIVIDGGSWKTGFEEILPVVDYAICSANFYPPNCESEEEVFAYLASQNIPHIAITQGEKSIKYFSDGKFGNVEVPKVNAVDTLGAGDIFHGAFCHYIFNGEFTEALTNAANIAAHSCQYFGTRQWMIN
ncbi:MAG: sugar kinase [Trichodesmium sp. St15_bin1_1]|nr:sugar kinase [Trichodesmium sp. St18_bin1]MDE5087572.1 sugar kinase [Trichodesmium sp. St16_bin2-tuft]MDE5107648.1 sugar kinase [Trichodesmium sp. St17_bin3_1_1]MDE5113372.1 sugar kinase [Trichodesmium sp. St15_bin1_1]MDE5115747.1 sugar kinase [Trichodesmium sp. St2_bin2_1]